MKKLFGILLMFVSFSVYPQNKVVNIYAWTGEIPDSVVRKFENETGIKVNLATFENNEIMYAKLRAIKNSGYDLVMPSSYFVDRMVRQNMLEVLDKTKLPNWKNLNPTLTNPIYDPGAKHCLPFLWGVTGIFVNNDYFAPDTVKKWSDLWESRFYNQLMLLDDSREAFSMTLLSLGYSLNDSNPEHIKEAFIKLKALMKNVKVFASDTVVAILTDDDATAGTAWNGDVYKASQENPHVQFVFPEEGFPIWVDHFAIPKNAPHLDNAYIFLNFILRPDIAKEVALYTSFAIANAAGEALLPKEIRQNPTIYPPKSVLARGEFQKDLSDEVLALYEKYWEELKLSA